ncbi:MAG TPA: endonuclease [Dehalococcoidia bacterium]|nr:endonuclease [Dehalococcoidia bacterium]
MSPRSRSSDQLRAIYRALASEYSYDDWHWNEALLRGPLDMPVSAVLVQHTTWQNAERALEQLRAAGALDAGVLLSLPEDRIAALTRVSGTPTVKARRLRALAAVIVEAGGMDALLALPAAELRARLLATHGIGPETADAIALYAAGRPAFVVDAYAQRLFRRIGVGPESDRYADWQRWLEGELAGEGAAYFQRYHAYIVLHCKRVCRATPRCASCMLAADCDEGRRRLAGAGSAS